MARDTIQTLATAAPRARTPVQTIFNAGRPIGTLYTNDFSARPAPPRPSPVNTSSPNVAGILQTLNPTGTSFLGPRGTPDFANGATGQAGFGGGGGFNFSLAGDPFYQQALAAQQQGLTALDAYLRGQREQAIVRFGDPSLANALGFSVDPQTAAFAQQNLNSGNATLARLNRQHDLGLRGVVNNLAARGLLQSGDLGYLQGQENQNFGNQVFDARNQVVDLLNNVYQNYLDRRNAFQGAVTQAAQQAYQNALGGLLSGGF